MYSVENDEKLIAQKVTYTIYKNGQFHIVENVPARVNLETGEQYFSPDTVENLQKIILGQGKQVRTIQTPVYEFA